MCGISGFVNAPGGDDQKLAWLKKMNFSLRHRGPDGSGIVLDNLVGLAHCRLSIIDLAGGGQPMTTPDKRYSVVFNGEIYNFEEIRTNLVSQGVAFRTRSDTEALLMSYVVSGTDCLERLDGMFALAIWDVREKRLFAARDRMGKKPLYYTLQNGTFVFASELTALKQLPFLELEIDKTSIAQFLAYEYVPTPRTIFKNVYKLRPGFFLTFQNGELNTTQYWDLPVPSESCAESDEDCCANIVQLLGKGVKKRLVSDVPLGVFLSGGIDSSAVVALMAREVPAKSIRTFSIGFTEKSYDESPYSRLVARRFGTDHTEEILDAEQAGELLPQIVARQDEPMSDPSIVPTYLLSQITRKHVTVALGGDGGDELFAGYEYYTAFILADYYRKLPLGLRRRFIEAVAKKLPISTGYVSPGHVAEKFFSGVYAPEWLRTQKWLGAYSMDLQKRLWIECPGCLHDESLLYRKTLELYEAFDASKPLDKVFYLLTRQYLLDYILVKVDRCSMMNSLEVRAPFLDRSLVEYVFALPSQNKIRGLRRKYLLKKALRGILPAQIINRKKRGFLIPSALWLKKTLRPIVEEMFSPKRLIEQGLFRPEVIAELVRSHERGVADHRKELWSMLVLQLWLSQNKYRIV